MDEQNIKELQACVDRSKSIEHRVDRLEKQIAVINDIATSVAVMAEKMGQFDVRLTTLDENVSSLTAKPYKRIESVITKVIEYIAIMAVGLLLGKFGL